MYLYIFTGFLILANLACQSQQAQPVDNSVKNDLPSVLNSRNEPSEKKTDELVESFSDAEKIGVPRKNKIEISNYKKSKRNLAVIKFYSLGENNEWKLKQNFEFEKDDLTGCDPQISDFNNDGLKDVTYVSDVAARGANEVRKLFIYDKKKDELVYIKNSEEYPNMLYDKNLNCLNSFMIHGTSTTVFLKIEGDKLREFARVGNDGFARTVYLINKSGKEKVLRKDKITVDDIYTRYKTFSPLTAYTEEDLKQAN